MIHTHRQRAAGTLCLMMFKCHTQRLHLNKWPLKHNYGLFPMGLLLLYPSQHNMFGHIQVVNKKKHLARLSQPLNMSVPEMLLIIPLVVCVCVCTTTAGPIFRAPGSTNELVSWPTIGLIKIGLACIKSSFWGAKGPWKHNQNWWKCWYFVGLLGKLVVRFTYMNGIW